jgi:hypothetical protein
MGLPPQLEEDGLDPVRYPGTGHQFGAAADVAQSSAKPSGEVGVDVGVIPYAGEKRLGQDALADSQELIRNQGKGQRQTAVYNKPEALLSRVIELNPDAVWPVTPTYDFIPSRDVQPAVKLI